MKIGIDLSVLQTPHRMRGIGATAINFMQNIPSDLKSLHEFILYLYEEDYADALSIIAVDGLEIKYEVRFLEPVKRYDFRLPGPLRLLNSALNGGKEVIALLFSGDRRLKDTSGLDVFLQFDPMMPAPNRIKTTLVIYDLIPYVMESDYLWSYKTARHYGDSRKSAARKAYHRWMYAFRAKQAAKSAHFLQLVLRGMRTSIDDKPCVPRTF